MIYNLTFLSDAFKEWNKLNPNIRKELKKKLDKRLIQPAILNSKLSSLENCYKIRAKDLRLVYQIIENRIVVKVIAVGKRQDNEVYNTARERLEYL